MNLVSGTGDLVADPNWRLLLDDDLEIERLAAARVDDGHGPGHSRALRRPESQIRWPRARGPQTSIRAPMVRSNPAAGNIGNSVTRVTQTRRLPRRPVGVQCAWSF